MSQEPSMQDVMSTTSELVALAGELLRENPREAQAIQSLVVEKLRRRNIPREMVDVNAFAAEISREVMPETVGNGVLVEPIRKLAERAQKKMPVRTSAPALVGAGVAKSGAEADSDVEITGDAILGAIVVVVLGAFIVTVVIYGAIRAYQRYKYGPGA